MKRLQRLGIFGVIGGGILCFTPLLALGLGAIGLSSLVIYADVLVGVILIINIGFLCWLWWQRRTGAAV